MLTSAQLKDVVAEARPIIERQIADATMLAGLRDVVAAAGGDWAALKALVKASIQDLDDEAGDHKKVGKVVGKAEWTRIYADMLGLGNLNEKNSFDADDDDQTVDAEQEEVGDDDASEQAAANGRRPALAPPPDELGTAGDDQGEPDALNTERAPEQVVGKSHNLVITKNTSISGLHAAENAELSITLSAGPDKGVVADPTGAGLNPLSPSEEAATPVNQSTAARMDGHGTVRMTPATHAQPEPQDRIGGSGNDPQRVSVAAGTQAPPVDTNVPEPLRYASRSEPTDIAGKERPESASQIPEPERAAVGEKPGTAIEAQAGAAGSTTRDPLWSGAAAREDAGSVAPVASPNSRDGLYSADWLRRHGRCQEPDNCSRVHGHLCIVCSRTIAVVAGGKSIPHQGLVNA